jgi:hypothetical protein
MLVGIFFVLAGMMIITDKPAIADTDDTVWYLENSFGVCSSCHVENKKGHFTKNECDKCHEPGAKKEVHSVPLLLWNVDVVDEWRAHCGECHTENKSGHIAQKKQCLRCHGPDGKKDVHNYTVDVGGEMECADCHIVDNGIIVDGPAEHLEDCTVCHQYF